MKKLLLVCWLLVVGHWSMGQDVKFNYTSTQFTSMNLGKQWDQNYDKGKLNVRFDGSVLDIDFQSGQSYGSYLIKSVKSYEYETKKIDILETVTDKGYTVYVVHEILELNGGAIEAVKIPYIKEGMVLSYDLIEKMTLN